MNKKHKIRKKIDLIDQKLLILIKQRTQLVVKLIRIKKYKHEIVDNKRMNVVLKKIKKGSIKNKIDPKITKKIWIAMIKSYVDFQRKNFKKR